MSWEPMDAAQAQQVLDEFFARARPQGAITLGFEEHVRLLEAWMVHGGAEPDAIWRELEEQGAD
jgi:hypothetical protein